MRQKIAAFLLSITMSTSAYSDDTVYTCSPTVAYWLSANKVTSTERLECRDELRHGLCSERNVQVKIVDGYLFFGTWEPKRLYETKSGALYVPPHLGKHHVEHGVLHVFRSYVLRIHDDKTASIDVRWLNDIAMEGYVSEDITFMACEKR